MNIMGIKTMDSQSIFSKSVSETLTKHQEYQYTTKTH